MAIDPISAILAAASIAGAIKGGERKTLDLNWLRENFGPHAVTEEVTQLFDFIINSPQGTQLIASAAAQGQAFQQETEQKAAAAGATPSTGAATGAGIFATSAGSQAANANITAMKSNLMQALLPIAQDAINQRMNAYLGVLTGGGYQPAGAQIWSQIGNAAGVSALSRGTTTTTSPPKTDTSKITATGVTTESLLPKPVVDQNNLSLPRWERLKRSNNSRFSMALAK